MYKSTLFYDYVNELFDIIFSASIDLGLARSEDEHKQIRCKQGISRMLLNILDNIPSELIGQLPPNKFGGLRWRQQGNRQRLTRPSGTQSATSSGLISTLGCHPSSRLYGRTA